MAKSNYPEKLDTSIEIPAVRDNIAEIGSDVINSIRMAIFQIERTLGINPQGSSGNSVASRLNRSLDLNGNIRKEAIDSMGLLSGPISNKDIAKKAGIDESKINLRYPTNLLQEEISQLVYQLDVLDKTIEELSRLWSAHVHPSATNRHPASAIMADVIKNSESSTATTALESKSVQDALAEIYSSHINYDGSDISSSNRSHLSKQIFFNNENISSYVSSANVQDAIEEVLTNTLGQLDDHQGRFHSNSIERISKIYGQQSEDLGILVLESEPVSFFSLGSSSDSEISRIAFSEPPEVPAFEIKISDIIRITDNDEVIEAQISGVNYSSDELTIESLDIFKRILTDSSSAATASVYRNKNRESNFGGLLLAAREYESLGGTSYSNADIVQISNPSACSIITKECRPLELSLTNRFINISVDNNSPVSFDLFDAARSSDGLNQTIESILKSLNEQFSENRMSLMAYRVDFDDYRRSEICISHILPNTTTREHSIKISRGSDDCIDSIGFSDIEDKSFTAGIGTSFYIKGSPYNYFKTIFEKNSLDLLPSTSQIFSEDSNFIEAGIRPGHIISIFNSPADDGSYTIVSVSADSIVVDKNQLPGGVWSSSTSESAEFLVYSDSISLNGFAFRASPGGVSTSSVMEIFLNEDRILSANELLTYGMETYLSSESIASPCFVSGDTSVYTSDSPGNLYFEKASADPADKEILVSLDNGAKISIESAKERYIDVYSGRYNLYIKVFILNSDTINSKIVSDGTPLSMSLYGHIAANKYENNVIGQVLYESGNSRVAGAGKDYPRPFSSIRRGGTGLKDIGSDVRDHFLVKPHLEKRSNGVIRGLEILSVTDDGSNYVVSISSGICYVKGKRFELNEVNSYVSNMETGSGPTVDKFYIAINEFGEVVFSPADPVSCGCTLDPYSFTVIGSVENNSSTISVFDLRLIISDLDYQILNSIKVSPQPGMGHFSDINKALKYAKRFSEIFPNAGTPTIHLKSGTHRINVDIDGTYSGATDQQKVDAHYDHGVWINFPVNIIGEGDSTVIDLSRSFSDAPISSDDRNTESSSKNKGRFNIAAHGWHSPATLGPDLFTNGFIKISNIKMKSCGINFLGFKTKDSSEVNLNFHVHLDSITFDETENPNFGSGRWGVKINEDSSDPNAYIGNIKISNCKFLRSNILSSVDGQYLKNVSIIGNSLYNSGTSNDGEGDIYLWYQSGGGYSILSSPAAQNNTVAGNITTVWDGDSGKAKNKFNDAGSDWEDQYPNRVRFKDRIVAEEQSIFNSGLTVAGGNFTIEGGIMSQEGHDDGEVNTFDAPINCGGLTSRGELGMEGYDIVDVNQIFASHAEVETLYVENFDIDNLGELNVSDLATFSGGVYIDDPGGRPHFLEVTGDIWCSNITIDDTINIGQIVGGSADFDDPCSFADEVFFNDTIEVSGRSDFLADAFFGNDVEVDRDLFCGNDFHVGRDVFVDSGDLDVGGEITKGSGSFKIDHPNPEITKTHWLYHSFVESPNAGDNIYRFSEELASGDNFLDLPEYYKYLNKDTMIWISPVEHFGRGWGKKLEDEDNKIKVCVDQSGIYNILVIGTRKDPLATKNWKGAERKKESKDA